MKFLADEGVDNLIVSVLRQEAYDVLYIAEYAPSISDKEVLAIANDQSRILITRDKDFGELIFRFKKVHSGIVLNRLHELNSPEKARIVLEVIKKHETEIERSYTVIQPGKVRIRKLM